MAVTFDPHPDSISNKMITCSSVPIHLPGKVVGIAEFNGIVVVACEYGIYSIVDDRLVRIKFEGEA